MASNDKAERRQMRQRGAGARDLGTVEFGFTFGGPAPLAPRASSRRTPQPLPAQLSSRRTPRNASQPAIRKTSAEPHTAQSGRSTRSRQSASVTSTSSKTQKSARKQADVPAFVTPSVTGKRKRGGSVQQAASESDRDELDQDRGAVRPTSAGNGKGRAVTIVPTPVIQEEDEDDLGQDDQEHILSSQRKKAERQRNAPISESEETQTPLQARQLARQVLAAMGGSREPETVQEGYETGGSTKQRRVSPRIVQERVRRRSIRGRAPDEEGQSSIAVMAQSVAGTIVQHLGALFTGQQAAPEPKPAASKSKSSKPLRSSKLLQRVPVDPQEDAGESEDELTPHKSSGSRGKAVAYKATEAIEENSEEEDELSPDRPQRVPASKKKHATPLAEEPEEETGEAHEETSAFRQKRSKPQPLKSREQNQRVGKPATKSKLRSSAGRPSSNDPAPKRRKRSDGVAISVYRFAIPRKRSKHAADDSDDASSDTDHLQSAGLPRVPGVNAVDVLNQITSEKLIQRSETMRSQARAAQNSKEASSLKRRRIVVQAFAAALSDRLFELTEAVDAGQALNKRVKEIMKEKLRLREEFLSIRREREKLALRMDEVRADHARRVTEKRNKDVVNSNLFDIEMAMQRGREHARETNRKEEDPEVPLEMLLKSVAKEVSSTVDRGLLERVKTFNGFLERAAGVIEGRV